MNTIPIKSWTGESEDRELLKLIPTMEKLSAAVCLSYYDHCLFIYFLLYVYSEIHLKDHEMKSDKEIVFVQGVTVDYVVYSHLIVDSCSFRQ